MSTNVGNFLKKIRFENPLAVLVFVVIQTLLVAVLPTTSWYPSQVAGARLDHTYPYVMTAVMLLFGVSMAILQYRATSRLPWTITIPVVTGMAACGFIVTVRSNDLITSTYGHLVISVLAPLVVILLYSFKARVQNNKRWSAILYLVCILYFVVVLTITSTQIPDTDLGNWISAWNIALILAVSDLLYLN